METWAWKTVLSYILGVVALGCLAAGIVSEVLYSDPGEKLGLITDSWYYVAIAVFMAAAWLAILRLRSTRKVRSIPPESE
ncbi:MAG TPA: hypothetical protein VMX96_06410 [Dehalococcoidia bacterium]|nr:hypothetical protein [Dehalococcoidia bacterium]